MTVKFNHRRPDAPMGRFGGGWQWKLGFQASADLRTVIVSLLIFSVRFTQ